MAGTSFKLAKGGIISYSTGVPSELVDLLVIADEEQIPGFDEMREARSISGLDMLTRAVDFSDSMIETLSERYGHDPDKPDLYHPIVRGAWKLKRGLVGELDVIAHLEHAFNDSKYQDFDLYNNVHIEAGGRCQIDHVLAGLSGVIHIETKNWRITGHARKESFEKQAYKQLSRSRKICKRYLKQVQGFPARAYSTVLCAPHDQFSNVPNGVELVSPLDAIVSVLDTKSRVLTPKVLAEVKSHLMDCVGYYANR